MTVSNEAVLGTTVATEAEIAYLEVALHALTKAKDIAYRTALGGEAFGIVKVPYRAAEDALSKVLIAATNSRNREAL